MCSSACGSLCLNHCLNCCFCILATLWVCFYKYLMPFVSAVLCGVHLWSAFVQTVGKLSFSTLVFVLKCKRFLVTHLHSHSCGKNKMEASDRERTWLLSLMEHENDRIPLGVTIWKQTCTRLLHSWFYHPSFSLHFIFNPLFYSLPDNWH